MKRFRPRGLTVMATLFVVTGLALMFASLRIESNRSPAVAQPAADIVVPTVAADASTKAATAPASDPDATRLFARAQAATRTVAYGGVKQVSRWTNGRSTKVVVTVDHVPGHGTVVSHGDTATAAATSPATVTVEPAADDETTMLEALVRNYRLAAGPSDKVLGREATTLIAHRVDGTVAARFWVDDATGLVLRRELVTPTGDIAETASYTKVRFTPRAVTTPTAAPAAAWSVVEEGDVDALRAEGWPIPTALSDGMSLYQVREQVQAGEMTVQLSYTDGLVGISVFLQRGVLDRSAMSGFSPVTVSGGEVWARSGSLFFTWQTRPASVVASAAPTASESSNDSSRDIVVSALADSPNAPIGAVLTAFPPLPAEQAGVGEHLTRGVQRVGSWIDPLG